MSTFLPADAFGKKPLLELLPLANAPLHVDIGTGLGDFAIELARRHPDINVLGIETEWKILKRAIKKAQTAQLTNIRFISIAAQLFLTECLGTAKIDHIWINFPDPWPKDSHEPRRFDRLAFLTLLATVLKKDGQLHLATDVADFFDRFTLRTQQSRYFQPLDQTPWQRRTLNIQTKYERKWQQQNKVLYMQDWQIIKQNQPQSLPVPLAFPDDELNHLLDQKAIVPGVWSFEDHYVLKIQKSRKQEPNQFRFFLIDRANGLATPGKFDLSQSQVRLFGVWTTWKYHLIKHYLTNNHQLIHT